jgi:hypothetical protein
MLSEDLGVRINEHLHYFDFYFVEPFVIFGAEDEVLPRVASIAFTDSVHSPSAKKAVRDWMKQVSADNSILFG